MKSAPVLMPTTLFRLLCQAAIEAADNLAGGKPALDLKGVTDMTSVPVELADGLKKVIAYHPEQDVSRVYVSELERLVEG